MFEHRLHAALDRVREHGASHLKVEFEAEGASSVDAEALAVIARNANLGLAVKVGGCEAVRDIREAVNLRARSIVAPMIESPFAAAKFERAVTEEVNASGVDLPQLAINIESATGISALPHILQAPAMKRIDRMVLGRTDLADSLNLNPAEVEGTTIEVIARRAFGLARDAHLTTTLGGTVTSNSVRFIASLRGLIDSVETRKVVFAMEDVANLPRAIEAGVRFELAWLEFKSRVRGPLNPIERRRLQVITARINLV
ncbi:aldolase/citrate lyase family protein [Mycolicibacterium sp. F2034L]|uniref:aldolase/citrate lyase family protein n=1 Tax=Mycolicibacterium sp. F2034L TaxID=2926422 RepID=UPI001FF302D6|nr:aldolase/citrate lyase family protein [Mycolicibacterium sp. F2034L]MCK0177113.1 aldolase/citrate lyase family protein [Mycolicibacterium sp. F2034L]